MGTLGKAAGVGGAFVAGSETAIEYLLQKGRSYIFTTAQPPAIACALSKSLQLIQNGDALRASLMSRIGQLRDGLSGSTLKLPPSITAIQPLIIGENDATVALSKALWERGLWVPAIRPPTVPKGTARLRISLSAAHTAADIDTLCTTLKELT
jgi:8-amino-7-oxononanoate synthase